MAVTFRRRVASKDTEGKEGGASKLTAEEKAGKMKKLQEEREQRDQKRKVQAMKSIEDSLPVFLNFIWEIS